MSTIYVGMDIHKNFIQAVAMGRDGKVVEELKLSNETNELIRFIKRFEKVEVAIEATSSYLPVYLALEQAKAKVTLVNTRRTKIIAEAKLKTDKLNALALANCLRSDFIAKAYVPSKEIRELRNLVRHRISLRKYSTSIKNRIHSLLIKNGIKHEFSDLFGKEGKIFLKKMKLNENESFRLKSYLKLLDKIEKEIKRSEVKIEKNCKLNSDAMLLTTIPGISYYSALLIIAEIADIKRFSSPKKLASYAGLVPLVRQSGSKCYHTGISKECCTNLKWILIQAAHIHVRYCSSNITKLFRRVMKKRGYNKAIVAAARKLITIIWHMLNKKETFKV